MKTLSSFLLVLLGFIASCSPSVDPKALTDAGSKALNAGDYQKAVEHFESALGGLAGKEGDSQWMRAKMGHIQALVRIDAGRAKNSFLELASSSPPRVTDREYGLVGSWLGDAAKLDAAIEVARAGCAAYPDSEHLKALVSELGQRAESSGDSGALESLKGLGYVGD